MDDLSSVKVGDWLLIQERSIGGGQSLQKVTRLTKKYACTDRGRYSLHSGRGVGSSTWDTITAQMISNEAAQALRTQWAMKRQYGKVRDALEIAVRNATPEQVPLEALEQALALLTPPKDRDETVK